MDKNITDKYLIDSLIHGDEKGILEIYTKLYPKIKHYILNNNGYEEDAKDIMQKALLILSLKLRSSDFQINSSFEGYFFAVCRNLWRKEKGHSSVTIRPKNDHISKMQEIASLAVEQEKWELFQLKLKMLSENCFKILNLYFDRIPNSKIAEDLGYSSENVVRQRIFKCKKKLKESIQTDPRYKEFKS